MWGKQFTALSPYLFYCDPSSEIINEMLNIMWSWIPLWENLRAYVYLKHLYLSDIILVWIFHARIMLHQIYNVNKIKNKKNKRKKDFFY